MVFTVILEYKGGTYISQVSGESPRSSLSVWVSTLRDRDLKEWGTTIAELKEIVESDQPVAVAGCRGVWCVSGSAMGGLALINIIATDVG
jgi:hypothetical protein